MEEGRLWPAEPAPACGYPDPCEPVGPV